MIKIDKDSAKNYLNQEIEEIKKHPLVAIWVFIRTIVYATIVILLLLYFITRDYECTTNSNIIIHIEEVKFHIYDLKSCKFVFWEDMQNFYKAAVNKVEYNNTNITDVTGAKWNPKIQLPNQ